MTTVLHNPKRKRTDIVLAEAYVSAERDPMTAIDKVGRVLHIIDSWANPERTGQYVSIARQILNDTYNIHVRAGPEGCQKEVLQKALVCMKLAETYSSFYIEPESVEKRVAKEAVEHIMRYASVSRDLGGILRNSSISVPGVSHAPMVSTYQLAINICNNYGLDPKVRRNVVEQMRSGATGVHIPKDKMALASDMIRTTL